MHYIQRVPASKEVYRISELESANLFDNVSKWEYLQTLFFYLFNHLYLFNWVRNASQRLSLMEGMGEPLELTFVLTA